jgi:hypothetical protein
MTDPAMRALERLPSFTVALAEGTDAPAQTSFALPGFLPIDRDGQSTVKPGGFLGLISI